MQVNKKEIKGLQYKNLQLSAQIKDAISNYHKKGTWKSKTGKMTRTLTGDTLAKPNPMTQDDIDQLFHKNQPNNKFLTENAEFTAQGDFTKKVNFLHLDDDFDKLLTGLPEFCQADTKINHLFKQDQVEKDLTSAFKKRYMVGKIIGEGAYASVRIAIDKKNNEKIAIKVYEKNKIKETQRKKSVIREIKVLQNLSHDNIMRILDVVETNNHLNIVTEYISGLSLGAYMKSQTHTRIPEKQCQIIFKGLTQALKYMHDRNIAHRDIKLENVILSDDLNPKFIDFGFSTCIEPLKKVKIFCGTPSYMAPEVVQRKEYRGEAADIWALGVLLFVSLTGNFPFKGSTDQELYHKINNANYPRFDIISHKAADLIERMLTISSEERITAEEILEHAWLKGGKSSSMVKLEKKKSTDTRKRIGTVTSMNSNEGKWTIKTSKTKKGLAETCKDNLQQEIRKALKSPKGDEKMLSYRKINKQNVMRHSKRINSKAGESAKSEKMIDLLKFEVKKRLEEPITRSRHKIKRV